MTGHHEEPANTAGDTGHLDAIHQGGRRRRGRVSSRSPGALPRRRGSGIDAVPAGAEAIGSVPSVPLHRAPQLRVTSLECLHEDPEGQPGAHTRPLGQWPHADSPEVPAGWEVAPTGRSMRRDRYCTGCLFSRHVQHQCPVDDGPATVISLRSAPPSTAVARGSPGAPAASCRLETLGRKPRECMERERLNDAPQHRLMEVRPGGSRENRSRTTKSAPRRVRADLVGSARARRLKHVERARPASGPTLRNIRCAL